MSVYKDGGTYTFVKNNKKYYVDQRIGSTTKGKVYDRYPGHAGATIVDVKPPKEDRYGRSYK